MPSPFKTVRAFQKCKLPMEEWNHRAHLTVAAFYLQGTSEVAVLQKMRTDIQRFNISHGLYTTNEGGYHETTTRFWIAIVRQKMDQVGADAGIEALVEQCGGKELLEEYYSPEVLNSWEARIGWVAPDLKPLPCDPGSWEETTPELISFPPEN